MPDHSDTSPPPERASGPAPEPSGKPVPGGSGSPKPKHRRRAIVWSLIVLASLVLVVSIIANWVQQEALETQQVKDTTDQIVRDEDIQQALATFAVDQLYANVDIQGEIQKKLPGPAQPLAAPVAAATRALATNVAERALASPQVQDLVSTAVARAHAQFVSLIDDKDAYVSTTGGNVTFEYGSVVADLAARLGIDPATISQIQGVVHEYSVDLKQRLTTVKARIESARATLSQVQAGELSPEARSRTSRRSVRAPPSSRR